MALTQISTQGIKDGTITGTDLATDFTTTGDFTFTGDTSVIRFDKSDDALEFADNMKATFGNSGDLAIFHNGTYSRIEDVGTGHFELTTNGTSIDINKGTTEYMARFFTDGAVELYHDNSKKFETTSDGVSIPNDNDKLKIGASQDLYLWHNGSTGNSNISNVTGDLFIQGNNGSGTAVNQIAIKSNAAVELNYQGTKKFETTSNGAAVTGNLFASNKFRGNDNVKLELGTGNDLQIYHDGSNSYLINTTGELNIRDESRIKLRTDQFVLNNYANDENIIYAAANGAVELYHDSSKRFETTSGGINVIGMIDTTENIDIDADNQALRIGASQNFQLVFTGSEAIIKNVGATSPIKIKVKDGVEDAIVCNANGAVELYHDNSKRLQTEAWGTRIFATGQDALLVVQGEEDRSATLRLQADDGDDYPDYSQFHKNKDTGKLHIQNLTGSDVWEDNIVCVNNGAVELYYDNSKKFETASYGVQVTGELRANDDIRIQSDYPRLFLTDTDNNNDYSLINNNGNFLIYDDTNNGYRMRIDGSTGTANMHWNPASNNSFDLGTTSLRWRNVYTNDLNLSNEGGANDVDGTWGSYTIQEGEDNLFLINNRNGKMFKFMLQEVIT